MDKPQGNVMSGPLRKNTEDLDLAEAPSCLSLDSGDKQKHYRKFILSFLRYNVLKREIQVKAMVSDPLSNSECKDFDLSKSTVSQFWVGLFAFPMIDNTRLTDGERFAATLLDITDSSAQIRLSYFPGSRASLKDKPYYDEIMKRVSGGK
jgi:hypothetical protein